jgi:hypothetical protein
VDGSDPAATKFAALPDFPDQGIESFPVNDLKIPHQTVATSVNWEEPVVDRETSDNHSLADTGTGVEIANPENLLNGQLNDPRTTVVAAGETTGSLSTTLGPSGEASGNLLSPLTQIQAAAKPLGPLGAPVMEDPESRTSNQTAKNATANGSKSADANSAFDWQSRPSSLGGILQRFQTQPSPKTSAETSKN